MEVEEEQMSRNSAFFVMLDPLLHGQSFAGVEHNQKAEVRSDNLRGDVRLFEKLAHLAF